MREKLISLGISEEESDLYLIMLQAGGGYASKLAKLAKRKRSSTYHTLEKLVDAGLARKTTRGKYNYFSPEPPEKLVQLSKLRLDTASSLLPELLSIQNTRSDKPRVQFFETFEGIEEIFQDSLNAKGEILGYTNLSLLNELFPEFFRKYTKARIDRKINVRYISPKLQDEAPIIPEVFPGEASKKYLEILFINAEQFPFENEIAIYENKLAIMSLSRDEKIGLLIESKTISDTMRAVFNLAWIGATDFVAR